MCAPIKLNFLFCKEKRFLMPFQTRNKLTFGLSDVFVVTVIARIRINGVGSLFFRDRIFSFGKNMPQSLKRFWSNFNVVAIQNSLDGFRNTLNVRNNSKTSLWADCMPSSLDSKAEERKYISYVLLANGYSNNFLRNCQNPVTTSSTLDEREPATGFAVIPYIRGVTEPIKGT